VTQDESASPFTAVPRDPSLVEKVAIDLRDAIVTGSLTRGTRLPSERDLGVQFGVSRTVIREAVRSLAAQGLLTVTSGRGVEVAGVDANTVADSLRMFMKGTASFDYGQIHEVRDTLEVATAGYAAQRASAEAIAHLGHLCAEHEADLARGDMPAASKVDFEFHRSLTAASDNELFVIVLDAVADVLHEVRERTYSKPGVGESGLSEHREILARVAAHDPEGARAAMAAHLAKAEAIYRSVS
jgi:GntR family transcriptional repressor for pyruvate dehydrogenase complex